MLKIALFLHPSGENPVKKFPGFDSGWAFLGEKA
jgi:hypothetical protein